MSLFFSIRATLIIIIKKNYKIYIYEIKLEMLQVKKQRNEKFLNLLDKA